MKKLITFSVCIGLSAVSFADHFIVKPTEFQGKVLTDLVWIQAVTMEPKVTGVVNGAGVIHNEVDQHELKGTNMGFGAGGWIPDSEVACTISKRPTNKNDKPWRIVFSMMSMVANDGPHYGRNVKLDGPGIYHEICQIDPPDWRGFFRHTDKESGVGPFFKPYSIEGTFTYTGSGKAGGY